MAKKYTGTPLFQGKNRFTGVGNRVKWDPRPGSVQWYKNNMFERFNEVASRIESAGFTRQFAEQSAARVLSWQERPLASMKIDMPEKCPSCGSHLVHKEEKETISQEE